MTSHQRSQDLAERVYNATRRELLVQLSQAIERLDRMYVTDARRITQELTAILQQAGVSTATVESIIAGVFASSRDARVALLEQTIEGATLAAKKVDEATCRAVVGGDRDAAPPFGGGRLGSPPTPRPSLRLVPAYVDSSQPTA